MSVCRVLICAVVSSGLFAGPLYAFDSSSELSSLNDRVAAAAEERRSGWSSLEVPSDLHADAGEATLYLADRDHWITVPAQTPLEIFREENRLRIRWGRDLEAHSGTLYSDYARVEIEAGSVYAISYAAPEQLLNDARGLDGYQPVPSASGLELLPESEEQFQLGFHGLAAAAGVGLFVLGFVIAADEYDSDGPRAGERRGLGDPGALASFGLGAMGLGWSIVLGSSTEEQPAEDNIAQNERRRRELEREQRATERANERLLEEANEEIHLRNRHAGYVSVEEVATGRATRVWLAE